MLSFYDTSAPTHTSYHKMCSADRDERRVIFVNRWFNKLYKHSRQRISDLVTFVNQEIVLVREG